MINLRELLHAEAKNRFNDLGTKLGQRMVALPAALFADRQAPFRPDTHSSVTVTEKDIIGDFEMSWEDLSGDVKGVAFVRADGARVGLFGEAVRHLFQLASAMHRVSPFRDAVTLKELRKGIFDWAKATFRTETGLPLADWLMDELESRAQPCEVIIPISGLHIESEIKLGKVVLKTFPKHFFDQFELAGSEAEDQSGRTSHLGWCQEMRERFQGLAAAHVRVFATPERASEIAYEQTDVAIGAFRLFAVSHFEPRFVSQWAPFRVTRKKTVFVGGEDGRCVCIFDALVDTTASMVVNDEGLKLASELGLHKLQELLAREPLSSFDESVLSAIGLFGRAALTADLRERLVWYCAGFGIDSAEGFIGISPSEFVRAVGIAHVF